ncbi:MAG: hypothetical protein ACI9J3_003378 [Parvicellaceae bacterium]|jgi:uncharacterized protein (DUF2132 family)
MDTESTSETPKVPETQETAQDQPNNPLHGVKLADILDYLVEKYGWEKLGQIIDINCFKSNPSERSSLKFLRRTAWARNKVEKLYLETKRNENR